MRRGRTSLFEQTQDALAAIPGVRSVSMSEIGAFTGNEWGMTVKVDGYQPKEDEDMNPHVDGIGPRYFETLGVPLRGGREFTAEPTRRARQRSRSSTRRWRSSSFATRVPSAAVSGLAEARPPTSRLSASSSDLRTVQLNREAASIRLHPVPSGRSVTQLTFVVQHPRRCRRLPRPPFVRPCSASTRICRSSI